MLAESSVTNARLLVRSGEPAGCARPAVSQSASTAQAVHHPHVLLLGVLPQHMPALACKQHVPLGCVAMTPAPSPGLKDVWIML